MVWVVLLPYLQIHCEAAQQQQSLRDSEGQDLRRARRHGGKRRDL